MEVKTKYFGILTENEELYLAQLKGVIESVDEYSSMEIIKTPNHINVRCVPSLPIYTNNIINALTQFHNTLGLRLSFSKSIKTSGVINFKLYLLD